MRQADCHVAAEADAGKRLDVYISEQLAEISRSGAQKLIDGGHALVNGTAVCKARHLLKPGDTVTIHRPAPTAPCAIPEEMPLDILYEDASIIVVNKPKGMVVHPAVGHESATLVNGLLYHCGGGLSGINGVMRPGIVHRIDKDTSGVLVAAKTNHAHMFLSAQLAAHSMTRVYNAIVHDGMREDHGTIDKPISRHATDRKKMAVAHGNQKGRRAVTHYRVLERLGPYTFIEARLETGRTHQIRVHMAHLGHPLLGDAVYGRRKPPFNTQGQMLHAKTLGFLHPDNGREMLFEAPLPDDFEKALALLRC